MELKLDSSDQHDSQSRYRRSRLLDHHERTAFLKHDDAASCERHQDTRKQRLTQIAVAKTPQLFRKRNAPQSRSRCPHEISGQLTFLVRDEAAAEFPQAA